MRAIRLSIVTPTRHSPHLMDRLYNCLVRQTCPDFEHVLVDTSVDDRTQERWWRDFAPHLDHRFRYARIALYRPEIAGAFEHAFSQARGEYVCPMTHKAMWRADGIEDLHRILDRYPNMPAFSFKSLYADADIHTHEGDFREMDQYRFGSTWDGSAPVTYESSKLFFENVRLFEQHGYFGPHVHEHCKSPFSSHALFSSAMLDRVRDRFGTLVAGKFAGDSRLGYRIMDLEEAVYHFPSFEPRVSSTSSNTGAAGSQLESWAYLCKAFDTLSAQTKQEISRSPFGYLPLWEVMNCWELFSVVGEAQGHLKVRLEFDASKIITNLMNEIRGLRDVDEGVRTGLLHHGRAIAARCDGGVIRKWF